MDNIHCPFKKGPFLVFRGRWHCRGQQAPEKTGAENFKGEAVFFFSASCVHPEIQDDLVPKMMAWKIHISFET